MLLVITWSIKEAEESVIRVGLFKSEKNLLEFNILMLEAAGSFLQWRILMSKFPKIS